ncbi:hypothetical protein OA90_27580 [Labrenzia sp. OB1]|nr:hypothetical protein OA90_27580 [Labrenzia sp. OB1]
MTIFVPIFGYFIIFNDAFVSLLSSSMEWACLAFGSSACSDDGIANLDDEFMLRKVINIYVALSAIALSTAVFQALCPHEIKKFWHVENYVAENTKIFHHEFNRRIREVLDTNLPDDVSRIQDRYNRDKLDNRSKASEMYDRDILALWFGFQNERFEISRWLCFLLFCFGVAFLIYPTLVVFVKVCGIILVG